MDFCSDTVLVTGASGFTGRHLVTKLRAAGHRVAGTTARHENAFGHPGLRACDLADAAGVRDLVADVRPDAVIHLAAISFVPHADAAEIYRVNVLGTENLLRALAALEKPPRRVIAASSANVYGNPAVDPVDESACPRPVNHYACSKLAMEHIAATYFDRLSILLTRAFNYTGPGQSEQFLVPKIVAAFRRQDPVLELGNLDVVRDISDVRNVVAAYQALLDVDVDGVAVNICSGHGVHLSEIVDTMAEIAGYRPEVRVNPAFVRSSEIQRLVGSRKRLDGLIGEQTPYSLREILQRMWDQDDGG